MWEGRCATMAKYSNKSTTAEDALDHLDQVAGTLIHLRGDVDQLHRLATLGTLAASIAHEINNILTPVLGYAQLAKSEPGDTQLQAKALERAIAGVEAASSIAEAMLGFARPDDENGPANIQEALNASLACLAYKPGKDGVQLHADIDPSAAVGMPLVSLQQVIINLLLNAFNVLKGKRGDVYVTCGEAESGLTQIVITDTGPGIPVEVERTLFEPFVTKGDAVTSRKGSGLGLAVCKQLIESAGGSITVSTKLGEGTAFTVRLPSAAAQPPANQSMHDRGRSSTKAA